MRATLGCLLALSLVVTAPSAQSKTSKNLDIYIIDAEGGKATLFVSPNGETALIDSGNPGTRDVDRIMTVLGELGITKLDYLISTHYHVDHIGGMQELAKRVPITTFVDHGPSIEPKEQVAGFQQAYAELYGKAKHVVVKAGDKLPIAGLDWRIVTAGGKAIRTPLPGGGRPNPVCATFKQREVGSNPDENSQSVGSVIMFGKFKTIDLGDLLWNNEFDLMCPSNPIGTVDLYLTSHHGIDASGSEALVHGLAPRVAITQNGVRKGATVQTSRILNSSANLEDVWQLHWAYNSGTEHNPAGLFIANIDEPSVIAAVLTAPPPAGRGGPPASAPGTPPAAASTPGAPPTMPTSGPPAAAPPAAAPATSAAQPGAAAPAPAAGDPAGGRQGGGFGGGGRGGPGQPHTGAASLIKVSAQADGTFTVTNTRNGFSRTYKAR
jgi:competence protein ComEC